MRVTLDRKGVIYLNREAWAALGKPEAVELLFDPGRRVIGLQKTDAWRPNAFPVKHKRTATGKTINASPFCNHFMIWTNRVVLFNTVEIDDEGIMSLPIDSLTVASRKPNPKR